MHEIKGIKRELNSYDGRWESSTVCVLLGVEEPWLLLANRKSIRQVSLDGKFYSDVFSNLSRTVALDFDAAEGNLYWTDVSDNAIYRTHILFGQNGSHPRKVGLLLQRNPALTLGRTRFFFTLFQEDFLSAPAVLSSCTHIPYTHYGRV